MFDGVRFVITGAAQGIGAGTARLAASKGAKVVVADVNDDAGKGVVETIITDGGSAEYFHCDVTDSSQIRSLMGFAAETYGGIDVLHNNAGVHENAITKDLSLESLSEEVFDKILSINLKGTWLCSKYALPYLKESPYPSIVNAGSISAFIGFPGNLAYGSSKTAIAGLTRNLAVDLAQYRIRVNCYCPASIRTKMVTDYMDASPDPDATLVALTNWHLIPRLGEPTDIANLVCFLASKDASFITGAVWLIDAGALAWRGTADTLNLPPAG